MKILIWFQIILWSIMLVFGVLRGFPPEHINIGVVILNIWLAAAMVTK